MRCRLCAGSGRIVLLAGMFADMSVRSSFRTEECHFCRGAGRAPARGPSGKKNRQDFVKRSAVAAADA